MLGPKAGEDMRIIIVTTYDNITKTFTEIEYELLKWLITNK